MFKIIFNKNSVEINIFLGITRKTIIFKCLIFNELYRDKILISTEIKINLFRAKLDKLGNWVITSFKFASINQFLNWKNFEMNIRFYRIPFLFIAQRFLKIFRRIFSNYIASCFIKIISVAFSR